MELAVTPAPIYAPVAQWIRASGFYPLGRGFESLSGCQIMSISKHIYYSDSEYPRTVILNHGGSETQVLSDSDDKLEEGSKKFNRVWKSRMGSDWRIVVKGLPEEENWLSAELDRARKNGDLK